MTKPKAIDASGCLHASGHRMSSQAVLDYEGRIGKLQDEKQRLYEALVLGDICQDEYKARKAIADSELERVRQVHEASPSRTQKNASNTVAMEAARKALRKQTLTQDVVDLLINKVLVYPGDRIEIVWKLSGFMGYMSPEAATYVAT